VYLEFRLHLGDVPPSADLPQQLRHRAPTAARHRAHPDAEHPPYPAADDPANRHDELRAAAGLRDWRLPLADALPMTTALGMVLAGLRFVIVLQLWHLSEKFGDAIATVDAGVDRLFDQLTLIKSWSESIAMASDDADDDDGAARAATP
jgi:hypothetical protein